MMNDQEVMSALLVIGLSQKTREWLFNNDPKALMQVDHAINNNNTTINVQTDGSIIHK